MDNVPGTHVQGRRGDRVPDKNTPEENHIPTPGTRNIRPPRSLTIIGTISHPTQNNPEFQPAQGHLDRLDSLARRSQSRNRTRVRVRVRVN